MKTFKIFNNTISFDEGIIDYIQIMKEAQSYKLNFNNRYIVRPKKSITSVEDFALYVQELYNNGFSLEFMKLSEELVNIYVKYGIYDMSKEMIQAKNTRVLTAHLEKLNPILDEITTFVSQVNQGVVDIEAKWQSIVDEAVPGLYFNMYSSSYTDLLLNDYFNHKEEKRVAKKRQRLYAENANKTVNDYLRQIIPLCEEYIRKIEIIIYEDIITSIDTMYKNCAMDLVSKGKITSFIPYIGSYKTNAVIDNLNKITDEAIIEEQIVNLLQTDVFNPYTHTKVIEYLKSNDMSEYAELIKFLKLQDDIFCNYCEERVKGNHELSNKYLNVLKSIVDTFDIENLLNGLLNPLCNYSEDTFLDNIKLTKKFFEYFKEVFGTDNKIINEKEQKMFITAIKEASIGTNLTYDGSIMHLDYDHLCEFWEKARNQHNSTIKRQEITQDISNSFANWARNHIKGILIIIIIIIIYFLNK